MTARLPGDSRNEGLAGSTWATAVTCIGRLTLGLTIACFVPAGSAQDHASSKSFTRRSLAASSPEAHTMKIRLTTNGKTTTATLIDSPTTRDFVALLPLTLTLEDYASTEKIAYLPKTLSTENAPKGVDPDVGDITYYAPWGNLAIFYRDFGYATGLVRLGRFDAGIEAFEGRGTLKVTIEATK